MAPVHPLIVLEGADGTGKETQAKLLMERLRARGAASLVEFPMYDTPTGQVVKRMLTDKAHPPIDIPPHVASWPFTLDRVAARPALHAALERGPVVANRYVEGNIGYQCAKLSTSAERQELVDLLEQIEYEVFKLPRPSVVVVLDVPAEISRKLLLARAKEQGRALDEYEKSLDYQVRVGEVYRWLAEQRPNWTRVACTANGVLRSRDDIAADVWSAVEPVLGGQTIGLHDTSKAAGVGSERKGVPSLAT